MNTIGTIRGYANIFDQPSSPLAGDEPLIETIKPGAFRLLHFPVAATVMHAGHVQVATTLDKSLSLWMDSHGLAFLLNIPATLAGAGLRAMIADGFCSMSFGLIEPRAKYYRAEDGSLCRDILRCDLNHISFVRSGAYASACCWLSSTPPDRLPARSAAASRRWQLGVIARDRKQASDRALVARYQAKLAAERKAEKPQYKPEPIQMPPDWAWFGEMQAAWF
jgi:HK97 family phage prohead protease